jgi:1-acyl-sn-glycerol-3-phosphate acyltransferase
LRSIWIWAASAALICTWAVRVAVVRALDRDPLRRRTAREFRRLGPALGKVNPWRIHVSGHENLDPKKTYVVVSNHQSLADIPLLAHVEFDAKWLGKAELFRVPVLGWMMRLAGDVPVTRSDPRQAAKALLQCGRLLRQGCSVVFFPEGTRSRDGSLLPFNEGPFQLAIREKRPVLPFLIEGSGAALPRNTWVFGGTQNLYLRVLPEIPVGSPEFASPAALRDAARNRIGEALARLREERG